MAMSEEEIPDTAQHYLVCGIEDCERNCQFYCNHCHRELCEQCRDTHQMSPDTNNHEVVPYKQRKPKLPEVKCKLHSTRNVEILCKECNIPLCPKCIFLEEHSGHKFEDLEEGYAQKVKLCQNEITKLKEYFLLTSVDLKMEIKKDITRIKEIMDGIRRSIKAEAESLKELIEKVASDKLEQVNTIENSLNRSLESQETIFDDYIAYLDKLVKEFHSYMSSSNFKVLFSDDFENLKIQSIPETTQPVLPVFTAGQFCRDDVTKLLGSIKLPSTEPDKRKIKPMETSPSQLKHAEEKTKQTQPSYSSVNKVREYTVPGVYSVRHISQGKSGKLLVSDQHGNLVQTDLQGNKLQKIQTNGRYQYGYHTVSQDEDLIYTDKDSKIIYRITQDDKFTELIKTGDWKPLSIHSSSINGELLVGMIKDGEAKVTRYNKMGEEIQNIQRDNKGQGLYGDPCYITENINGDICTSDKQAVVVVNKSGQHRFFYTGQGPEFYPKGICNDLLGYILVCDSYIHNNTVHLLDQDGQFSSFLLTKQVNPISVCVDNENNLYVGHHDTNKVTVYKYLQ